MILPLIYHRNAATINPSPKASIMSDRATIAPSARPSRRDLNNKWTKALIVLFLGRALQPRGHSRLPQHSKAIETKATADNATLKQKAEAELAEQKAINETQIAKYAERKQRADAKKATADAEKADSDAIIAREAANNAEVKARAEADAQVAEAEIKTSLPRSKSKSPNRPRAASAPRRSSPSKKPLAPATKA